MSALVGLASPVTLVPFAVTAEEVRSQPVEAACLALSVMSHYGALTGQAQTGSVRSLVVELVADLMHLCAQSGISFEAVVGQAGVLVDEDCAGMFPYPPAA